MRRQCSQCLQEDESDGLVRFGKDWVCKGCMPAYAQKLEAAAGEVADNACPYCETPRRVALGDYFRVGSTGEHRCHGCRKYALVEIPRWVGRAKFVVFLTGLSGTWIGLSFLTAKMESIVGRAAIFLLGLVAFFPAVLILQLLLDRLIFGHFTRLKPMDSLIGRFTDPALNASHGTSTSDGLPTKKESPWG